MVGENTIGHIKCPICGEENQDVRINKNGNLYVYCDNSCRISFSPGQSKKYKQLLMNGKSVKDGNIFITPILKENASNKNSSELEVLEWLTRLNLTKQEKVLLGILILEKYDTQISDFEELARLTCISRRQFMNLINKLEQFGYIKVYRNQKTVKLQVCLENFDKEFQIEHRTESDISLTPTGISNLENCSTTFYDYAQRAITRLKLRNQNALARELGISSAFMANLKTGKSLPSENTMLKIATLAGIASEKALIDLNIWRAKDDTDCLTVWQRISKKMEMINISDSENDSEFTCDLIGLIRVSISDEEALNSIETLQQLPNQLKYDSSKSLRELSTRIRENLLNKNFQGALNSLRDTYNSLSSSDQRRVYDILIQKNSLPLARLLYLADKDYQRLWFLPREHIRITRQIALCTRKLRLIFK